MARSIIYYGVRSPKYFPLIKRATGRLTDGRAVAMYINSNSANDGGDTTGVAKISVWLSNDSFRNDFGASRVVNPNVPDFLSETPVIDWTPPVAPCSETVQAVASLSVGTDNAVWISWSDTAGALHCTKWVYTPGAGGAKGTFGAPTDQVVSAANGITRRIRAIDMDVAGANNPIIATFEALASTNIGAETRVYVRNNDNTTWRRVVAWGMFGANFIRPWSEEISVSWHADGIVSNVGKFLLYMCGSSTSFDTGDTIREYQYNTATGVDNGATQRGDWFGYNFGKGPLHQNQGAGQRRAWIYKLNTGPQGMWLVAGTVGTSVPKFWATKLTTGNWAPPIINYYQPSTVVALATDMRIDGRFDLRLAVGCQYADNRLVFGFKGYSSSNYVGIFREVMFRYNSVLEYSYDFVDTIPRPLDGNGNLSTSVTPTAVYGGDNSRITTQSPGQFNWVLSYPVTPTSSGSFGHLVFVAEDVPGTPRVVYPTWASDQNTNRPTFKIAVPLDAIPPSHYAKVELQVATDTAFTQNVRSAIEPNKAYKYFSSIGTTVAGEKIVNIPGTLLSAPLFTGHWYIRARLVTDKGQVGPWTIAEDDSGDFTVVHPPVSTAITPKNNSVVDYGAGSVSFTWSTSDTEPTDTQSAYNVIISRSDTGDIILDTGWVASSAKSAMIAIPIANKDQPLQWKVRAKDIDGSQGDFSAPLNFTAGQVPDVTIASPSGGTTILNANSTFEVDVASWTMTAGTLARDTTIVKTGTGVARMTATGGTAQTMEAEKIAVTQGMYYYGRAWVRAETDPGVAQSARVMIAWYDVNDTLVSAVTIKEQAFTAATWIQLSGSAKPPATATKAAIRVMQIGAPTAGFQVRVDEAELGINTVTTALPTFSWNFVGYGSRTQRAFRVVITDLVTGIIVGDSLWQASAATSYTFASQILIDHEQYGITVSVQDIGGLRDEDSSAFQTDWVNPAQPATVTLAQDGFKTTITWSNTQGTEASPGGDVDPQFVAWRVWRRYRKPALPEMDFTQSSTVWELVAEFTDPTFAEFKDYQTPLNKPADYTVTQLAERFGSLVDSDIATWQTITCKSDRYYFVPEDLVGTIASYEASFVTADQFTGEVEQETIHVIGRGRQVQVGDDLGYVGTITIRLRNPSTARADREFLEYLASSNTNNVYIRSPFGDVLLVKLGNIGFNREPGMGNTDAAGNISDLGDLTVPYSEVIGNKTVVTRGNAGN